MEDPKLRGYAVEWAEPGFFVLSRRNRLFASATLEPPFQPLAVFPAPFWKALAAHSRIAQRLLRFLFYNVLRLPDGSFFVTFDRTAAILRNGAFHLLEGLVRPCRVLRGACATDRRGNVYFGEYLLNPDRHEVNVYRYSPGGRRLEIVHIFPPGSIRHVHGIYNDPYTGDLWCLSGDKEQECRMLRTPDGFRSVEDLGRGDETWRCVSLLFTADALYYASDAEFRQNFIFRVDRNTLERTVVGEVDGPVYYSKSVDTDLFFGVTAELCPAQRSRDATLWHVGPGGACSKVASFRKDRLPVAAFLPGTLHFPAGPGTGEELIFHGVGLVGADDRMFRVRLAGHPSAPPPGAPVA